MEYVNLKSIGPFIALALIFLLGVLVNDAFLSSGNLVNILARSAFIGIVAIGATFVITAGGIDLSVGSMAAFISGCMILLMNVLFQSINSIPIIICIAVLASIAPLSVVPLLLHLLGLADEREHAVHDAHLRCCVQSPDHRQ